MEEEEKNLGWDNACFNENSQTRKTRELTKVGSVPFFLLVLILFLGLTLFIGSLVKAQEDTSYPRASLNGNNSGYYESPSGSLIITGGAPPESSDNPATNDSQPTLTAPSSITIEEIKKEEISEGEGETTVSLPSTVNEPVDWKEKEDFESFKIPPSQTDSQQSDTSTVLGLGGSQPQVLEPASNPLGTHGEIHPDLSEVHSLLMEEIVSDQTAQGIIEALKERIINSNPDSGLTREEVGLIKLSQTQMPGQETEQWVSVIFLTQTNRTLLFQFLLHLLPGETLIRKEQVWDVQTLINNSPETQDASGEGGEASLSPLEQSFSFYNQESSSVSDSQSQLGSEGFNELLVEDGQTFVHLSYPNLDQIMNQDLEGWGTVWRLLDGQAITSDPASRPPALAGFVQSVLEDFIARYGDLEGLARVKDLLIAAYQLRGADLSGLISTFLLLDGYGTEEGSLHGTSFIEGARQELIGLTPFLKIITPQHGATFNSQDQSVMPVEVIATTLPQEIRLYLQGLDEEGHPIEKLGAV